MKRWETRGLRQGGIGEWVVIGIRYESEDGEFAWHTTSYPSDNPIHDFWVMDGEFRAMAIHYMYNMTMENRIWIGDVVEVEAAEKDAILQAIGKWESNEEEQPRR